MSYSESVLNAARARLAEEVQAQKDDYAAREAAIYQKFPEIREIDRALRVSMAEAVSAAFRSGTDGEEALAKVRERNLELQRRKAWILESNDYEPDYLDERPLCSKCGGSGYVGSAMCECLRTICRQEQKKAVSSLIGTGKERFSAFRLDVYSDLYDSRLEDSPRKIMQDNLEDCRNYAATFSEKSGSLLFTGKTGLGKTFLSGCIARSLVDRGFSVVYDSVGRILADFEAVKFGENTEESRRGLLKYREADLLIVDDLGTEMLTQFSMATLYTLLNDRILDEKPTIVSTNLSPDEIRDRYSPQISSRLLGSFDILYFYGEDIRTRGKI